jgi:very-short-patch-repair endonuclease
MDFSKFRLYENNLKKLEIAENTVKLGKSVDLEKVELDGSKIVVFGGIDSFVIDFSKLNLCDKKEEIIGTTVKLDSNNNVEKIDNSKIIESCGINFSEVDWNKLNLSDNSKNEEMIGTMVKFGDGDNPNINLDSNKTVASGSIYFSGYDWNKLNLYEIEISNTLKTVQSGNINFSKPNNLTINEKPKLISMECNIDTTKLVEMSCNGNKMRLCSNLQCLGCYQRSFSSHEKSKFFSIKNTLSSREVTIKSGKKFIFNCDVCCHPFDASPHNISKSRWCPYCSHSKLCDDINCISCKGKSFSSHPYVKYWVDGQDPRKIFKNSNNKYEFKCPECSHNFSSCLQSINAGHWCPYCNTGRLCGEKSCKMCFDKSFGSIEYSKYIVDKTIELHKINKHSLDSYLFYCDKCSHFFNKAVSQISLGRWCSFCAHQELCSNIDCIFCFNNSFNSDEASSEWSEINILKSREVFKHSDNSYYFDCKKCNHRYSKVLKHYNIGCQYCSHYKLCLDNCDFCMKNSFASHTQSKYWSPKNKNLSREILISSSSSFILICQYCSEEYEPKLYSVTDRSGCKKCQHKTELKLREYLSSKFNIIHQAKFNWCKNPETGYTLSFDFVIEEFKIIIELDGEQNFKENFFTDCIEESQYRDITKMILAISNGYNFIRISQVDVWNDRLNLDISLLPYIKKYSEPTIYFISTDEQLYNNHYNLLVSEYDIENINVNYIN